MARMAPNATCSFACASSSRTLHARTVGLPGNRSVALLIMHGDRGESDRAARAQTWTFLRVRPLRCRSRYQAMKGSSTTEPGRAQMKRYGLTDEADRIIALS